jgi:hypothetical protein
MGDQIQATIVFMKLLDGKKDLVPMMLQLDVKNSISWAWSSVNSVTLVRLRRKLLPDQEDDLEGFPDEELSKSKILEMACAMRGF